MDHSRHHYDLTRGNTLKPDWLVQRPDPLGPQGERPAYYPLNCKDCDPETLLPSCSTDADCPRGGTCGPILAVPSSVRGSSRKACFGPLRYNAAWYPRSGRERERSVDITLLSLCRTFVPRALRRTLC